MGCGFDLLFEMEGLLGEGGEGLGGEGELEGGGLEGLLGEVDGGEEVLQGEVGLLVLEGEQGAELGGAELGGEGGGGGGGGGGRRAGGGRHF